ncbi:Ribosomal protein L31 [Elusimicrobium minutum Pei191]|uniref:Large ribosomal subunit protein bL31 n=1 Tax=Elusimicrobium minutum (strain Pei191) TaxID=445932 RepID=B2KD86_ELUMP|nr:Ribosomal protein L31 [Elusimicrobium minutum Pei191]
MKEKIHPKYEQVEVVCACGAKFMTRSTMKTIKLDICSECHPFFTGKQKMLDTEGRVDKFNKKFAKTDGKIVSRKPKTEVKAKSKVKPVVKIKKIVVAGDEKKAAPVKKAKKEAAK